MGLYEQGAADGRDVIARMFVLESFVLVALGRQLATLSTKPAGKGKNKTSELEAALASIREDTAALSGSMSDALLRDKTGPVIDEILEKLRANIDQLSS